MTIPILSVKRKLQFNKNKKKTYIVFIFSKFMNEPKKRWDLYLHSMDC